MAITLENNFSSKHNNSVFDIFNLSLNYWSLNAIYLSLDCIHSISLSAPLFYWQIGLISISIHIIIFILNSLNFISFLIWLKNHVLSSDSHKSSEKWSNILMRIQNKTLIIFLVIIIFKIYFKNFEIYV